MKQIDEITYKDWKFLPIKLGDKSETDFKNAWYHRSNMRKVPSVIIYKWPEIDEIYYDINPGNIDYDILKNDEIWSKIDELVKCHLVIQNEYEMVIWISGFFKISSKNSEYIAEKIYDLLLEYIK